MCIPTVSSGWMTRLSHPVSARRPNVGRRELTSSTTFGVKPATRHNHSTYIDDVHLRCYVLLRHRCSRLTVSPFSVTVNNVPDRELGPLLTRLSEAGFENPVIRTAGATSVPVSAPAPDRPADLPGAWVVVREREGESYRWPKRHDHYASYRVFM